MNIGFASNTAAVESVTTSYVKVTLGAASGVDVRATAIPQAGYLSNIEIQVLDTAGSPTKVTVKLTWDTAGDHALTNAAEITLLAAQATADTYSGAVAIDKWYRSPTARTGDEVYAWCKTDAGTVTVQKVRLHWCDSLGR